MDIGMDQTATQGRTLDAPPPRPPRQGRSLMSMASDSPNGNSDASAGMDTSNPAIRVMMKWGEVRKGLLELSADLPTLAPGIQQMISGFEAVIPQQVADIVAGNSPGSSGSGLGASGAAAAPTAPPVQTGQP